MTAAFTLVTFLFMSVLSASAADTLKKGSFKGSSGVSTSGSVSIVKKSGKQKIVLSKSFKTKKGPSLWVYVGNGKPSKKIAKLKSIKGSQSYSVPASVDMTKYKNVYIYCKPFKKTFGSAKLK